MQRVPFYFFSIFLIAFMGVALSKTFPLHHIFPLFLLVTVLIGLVAGLQPFFSQIDRKHFSPMDIVNIISASLAGTVLTYALTQFGGVPVVISASLIGLMGYILSRLAKYSDLDLAPIVYMGTFVGMTAKNVLPVEMVAIAGILAGMLFVFLCNVFNGCGGKLGSIAFMSSFLTIVVYSLK